MTATCPICGSNNPKKRLRVVDSYLPMGKDCGGKFHRVGVDPPQPDAGRGEKDGGGVEGHAKTVRGGNPANESGAASQSTLGQEMESGLGIPANRPPVPGTSPSREPVSSPARHPSDPAALAEQARGEARLSVKFVGANPSQETIKTALTDIDRAISPAEAAARHDALNTEGTWIAKRKAMIRFPAPPAVACERCGSRWLVDQVEVCFRCSKIICPHCGEPEGRHGLSVCVAHREFDPGSNAM